MIVFLFFLCIGVVYYFGIGTGLVSLGDSGELITVAKTLGIAHPPGYPLYTLLAHFFTLIPYGSVAWRVNFFSAVLHLTTLFFFYKLLLELTQNKLVALGTTLVLAFSYTFWLYSLVAEVFPLNDLLAVVLLYLAFKRQWSWAAFVFGLGMSHHYTIVLLAPSLLYWFFLKDRQRLNLKFLGKNLFLFFLGLMPIFYLLWAGRRMAGFAWIYPQNMGDLWRMAARLDYGTFSPSDQFGFQKIVWYEQLLTFFRFFADDFSWLGIFLAVLGYIFLMAKKREIALFFTFSLLLSFLFLIYVAFPYKYSLTVLEVLERFYLLPNILMTVIICFGLLWFEKIFKKQLNQSFVLRFIFFVPGIFLLINNFSLFNQRNNLIGDKLGRNILNSAEEGTLLYVCGDLSAFSTSYAYYGEEVRPDIKLVTANFYNRGNDFVEFKKRFPEVVVPDNPDKERLLVDLVLANIKRMPIYIVDCYLPISEDLVYLPMGVALKAFEKNEPLPSKEAVLEKNERLWQSYQLPTKEAVLRAGTLGDKTVLGYYSRWLEKFASWCWASGFQRKAVDYYESSLSFAPDRLKARIKLFEALLKSDDCQKAEMQLKLIKRDYLEDLENFSLSDRSLDQSFEEKCQ